MQAFFPVSERHVGKISRSFIDLAWAQATLMPSQRRLTDASRVFGSLIQDIRACSSRSPLRPDENCVLHER